MNRIPQELENKPSNYPLIETMLTYKNCFGLKRNLDPT